MADQKYHPKMRLNPQGYPILKCTPEASNIKKTFKECGRQAGKILSPEQVLANAKSGKDALSDLALLGFYQLQCGQYGGKTFKWLLENDPGYVCYIALDREPSKGSGVQAQYVTENLQALVSYAMKCPEMKKMIDTQKALRKGDEDAGKSGDLGVKLVGFGKYSDLTYSVLMEKDPKYCDFILNKRDIKKGTRMDALQVYIKQRRSAALPITVTPVPVKMAFLSSHPSVSQRALKVSRSKIVAPPNLKKARSSTPSLSRSSETSPGTTVCKPKSLESSSSTPCLSKSSETSSGTCQSKSPESSSSNRCVSKSSESSSSGTGVCEFKSSSGTPVFESEYSTALPSTSVVESQSNEPSCSSTMDHCAIPYMRTETTSTVPEPLPPTDDEKKGLKWFNTVSPPQEKWMKLELCKLGLVPGTSEYKNCSLWEGQPLWRTPPLGELQKRSLSELPKPDTFWLHPMFVWVPELMCQPLLGSSGMPCITPKCTGCAEKKGIGRPRVVVGSGGGHTGMPDTGQYYIFASLLYCKKCKCNPWQADLPAYLSILPEPLRSLFPAHVTYNKAICKSLLDQVRRSGRSCLDLANEVKDLLQVRYERAHHQYLLLLQQVRSVSLGFETSSVSLPFGTYSCMHGWRGVIVSEQFIADMLIEEYNEQRPYLVGMMKGVFGRYWRSDHTRTLAKKVQLLSGVMWSYSTLNEYWEVVSWVMVDADTESAVLNYYKGLKHRYELSKVEKASITWVDRWCCTSNPTVSLKKGEMLVVPNDEDVVDDEDWNAWIEDNYSSSTLTSPDSHDSSKVQPAVNRKKFERQSACRSCYNTDIVELLDSFHCIRRFGRACVSEAHPAYPRFMSLLSCAFFIIDEGDLEALQGARKHLNMTGEPSKAELKRHCRTVIPPPQKLQKRVEAVMQSFLHVTDASGLRLFTSRMLAEWKLQRIHIQRGCLSDPVVSGDSGSGVLYRLVAQSHLANVFCSQCKKVKCDQTKLNVWSPLRGSSQLEGFHPHQAKWVTGTRVSKALFQAQSFLGLGRWNWKRAVNHRKLCLPDVFDPRLVASLNDLHLAEYGCMKYPDFVCSNVDSGEHFGIEYCQDDQVTLSVGKVSSESVSQSPVLQIQHNNSVDDNQAGSVDVVHIQHDTSVVDNQSESVDLDLGLDVEAQTKLQNLLVQKTNNDDVVDLQFDSAFDSATDGNLETTSTPSRKGKSPTKQQRRELTRNAFAGKVTYWSHEQWSNQTKNAINSLLARHRGKNRFENIVTEYGKMVIDSADDPHSELQMVNRRFIQVYERTVNRKLEGNACVNFSHEQTQAVEDVTTMLQQPQAVSSHIVTSPNSQIMNPMKRVLSSTVTSPSSTQAKRKKRKRKKKQDESSSDTSDVGEEPPSNTIPSGVNFAEVAQRVLSSFFQQLQPTMSAQEKSPSSSSSTAPKRKANPNSGTNKARNCLYCGKPKSKIKSAGLNLHHIHVKKGELCYHYCAKKVADKYGVSPETTFEEFKKSAFWDVEIERVRKEKAEAARKKEEGIKRRKEFGHKAPGPPKH